MHTRHLLAPALALAMLPAASIEAQTLSRAEAGRVAVANCYATCMDRAQTTSLALYARVDRITDLVISDEYFELDDDSQAQVVRLEEDAICALAQDHVRALDGCYNACTDVERAYGSPSALARGRFRHLFIAERDALRAVGLWGSSYADAPTSGAAFDAACRRYWDGASGTAADGLSRLATLPLRSGHRTRPPARVVEANGKRAGRQQPLAH